MSYQRISIEDDDLESGSYADHNNTTASAPPPPYGYDEVEANADVPVTKGVSMGCLFLFIFIFIFYFIVPTIVFQFLYLYFPFLLYFLRTMFSHLRFLSPLLVSSGTRVRAQNNLMCTRGTKQNCVC